MLTFYYNAQPMLHTKNRDGCASITTDATNLRKIPKPHKKEPKRARSRRQYTVLRLYAVRLVPLLFKGLLKVDITVNQ